MHDTPLKATEVQDEHHMKHASAFQRCKYTNYAVNLSSINGAENIKDLKA